MLRYSTVLFIILCLQLLAGCTTSNLSRGLYEGVRVRNDLQSSPAERFGKPESPDYQEYERMRQEQR
jgi:hypothetical protein